MVYLICGSPCSGKTTYIKNHAKDGDLVCDVDLIYQSISNRDSHDADVEIHEIALQLHYALCEIIKNRSMNFNNAYVVSIANTNKKLKHDIEKVKADKVVFIDTPYDVCIERAKERNNLFKLFVDDWFCNKEFINKEREEIINA